MKPPAEAEECESDNVRLNGLDDLLVPSKSDSAPPSSPFSSPPPHGGSDSQSPPASPPPPDAQPSAPGSIARRSMLETYLQVLALPIARCLLLRRFYKAIVVRNPEVVIAIKETMRRGQPYLSAFLFKDKNMGRDVITDINSAHLVGVFTQITSVFTATRRDDYKEEGLMTILYPHRQSIASNGLSVPDDEKRRRW
ncbi:hypothetical protein BD779DRAFT_1680948 [Infundibulicybe gibba]|nr:hypothetical protein BD779DRAFT_1680948 [Infundibulicybe gibba]